MSKVFLKKIKNALKKDDAIENITNIINEFEEIDRLVMWRAKILLNADDIDKHKEELKEIELLMEKYDYPCLGNKSEVSQLVKKYFNKYK